MTQELVDSVAALTEETTQLLEVYTQESLTLNTKVVQASASADRAEAAKGAALISETNAAASVASALQHKNEAEQLTQLSTWQQYKDDTELAASNAASSKQAAKTSETNAASSASQSNTYKQTTLGYRNESEQFAQYAESSKQSAASHEATTLGYKNQAATSASNSETSNQSAAAHNASANQHRIDAQTAANNSANSAASASQSKATVLASETNVTAMQTNVTAMQTNVTAIEQVVELHKADSASSAASANADADRAESAAADVTWKQYARHEAELNQMREQNENQFAASGFTHFGRQSSNVAHISINDGMYASTSSGYLFIGEAGESPDGTSKEASPHVNIAGFSSRIYAVNYNAPTDTRSCIKFPEAPDGTVIYDSTGDCRGTGKSNLNLFTEVDPKYGDIASTQNEAVARAFEGLVRNGDFRLGTPNWGTSGSASLSVTDGVMTITTTTDYSRMWQTITQGLEPNTTYVLETTVRANAGSTYVNPYVHTVERSYAASSSEQVLQADGLVTVKYTFTTENTVTGPNIRFEVRSPGTVDVYNASVRKATEEVVTERVDMFGGEFFLEEVSQANPYVYPKGMIQSQATTMNGIATVASNRPNTYYAVYDGDNGSKGLGVDFWAATTQQKIDMLSDESNNLFLLDDGRLVQWRMRQRTVAGVGNGDWIGSSPSDTEIYLRSHHHNYMTGQGIRDSLSNDFNIAFPSYASEGREEQCGAIFTKGKFPKQVGLDFAGLYTLLADISKEQLVSASLNHAVNGECYFQVWGVVPRLNQGAYHPSFNPMGVKYFAADTTGDGLINVYQYWYGLPLTVTVTPSVCFKRLIVGDAGTVGCDNRVTAGVIGGGSGRPDGKFYDAIYASGQGGVIDCRTSAWDMGSKEEASKVFQKVVNGSYRGIEQMPWNGVNVSITSAMGATEVYLYKGNISVYNPSSGEWENSSTAPSITNNADGYNWFFIRKSDGKLFKNTVWGNQFHTRLREWNGTQWVYPTDTASELNTEYYGIWFKGAYYLDDYPSTSLLFTGIPKNSSWGYKFLEQNPSGVVYGSQVSGEFTQTDVIGDPANIIATPQLANGWLGRWIPVIPDGTSKNYPLVRENVDNGSFTFRYTRDSGASWSSGITTLTNIVTNTHTATDPAGHVAVWHYSAYAKMTKLSVNKPVLNGIEGIGTVYATKYYASANAKLVESLIGKVPTNNINDPVYTNYPLTKGSLSTSGLGLGVISPWVGMSPEHTSIDLGVPNNDSPAVKALWYQAANNQQATLMFAANEIKHNGVDWGDDSTIHIVDGTTTYTNLNGETCIATMHELAIPYGYTKNQARSSAQVAGVDL